VVGEALGGHKDVAGEFAIPALLRSMFSPVLKPFVLSLEGFIHERPNIREVVFSKRGKKNFDVPWCHALWAFRARFYDDVSTNSSLSAIIDNKQIGLKPPLLLIIIIYIF
jgi:hypothetical protein